MNDSSRKRAGAGLPTPALFVFVALAFVLSAAVPPASDAIPKEEFPSPADKAKEGEKAPSVLEAVVERATEELRAGEMKPSPEAVEFARFVYSRSGDAEDLERSKRLGSLGNTPSDSPGNPRLRFGDAAMRSGSAHDRSNSLKVLGKWLDRATELDQHPPLLALALWRAGKMFGDEALVKRGKSIVEDLAQAQSPDKPVGPALGLAAGIISTYPTQMVLIGDPADPTLTAMREACFNVFEPTKILINLDPARDRERIEELGYPADMAPVLFVCVESICSAPIQDPAKVPETVKEIVKLSRSLSE